MTGSRYTLEAAREILLVKRGPVINAIDRLLGIAILAAGPVGYTIHQPWLLAAWGWVDQKNELVARLDDLFGAGRNQLRTVRGSQRHEVLTATHAALTVASFFAALRDFLGREYDELEITDEDIERLVNAGADVSLRDTVNQLFRVAIPPPWTGQGLSAHTTAWIEPWYHNLAVCCADFFSRLDRWKGDFDPARYPRPLVDQIVDRASARYRAEFLALAAEVPEFQIWALFGEHAAEQKALRRIEELTGRLVGAVEAGGASARSSLLDLNAAVLTEPIVDLQQTAEISAVRAPSVERGYIEPNFRWAVVDRGDEPARPTWWSHRERGTDLAGFLAGHLAAPEAAERPLVVLGEPGSGKSLFTKVCAARLAATASCITVRVPLREVPDPSASVYHQVEDVLGESTHGRVNWRALSADTRNQLRVVIIDGLDELMQATGTTKSSYLRDVMEFQRVESVLGGPVAVIVTSRTVVADLAAIPEGCTVVLFEDFSDDQVTEWADRWTEENRAAVSRGAIRPIDGPGLLRYGDLARQPLLLLLLAIVAAERELPIGDTSAGLFKILLADFVRRELARPDQHDPGLSDDQRQDQELWKLGLVAFGMFNRGLQHLREDDLTADLRALPGPTADSAPAASGRAVHHGRLLPPGRRVVGRFFFVHTSEVEGGAGGRSYEFLHATFADYLIAFHTLSLLQDAATARGLRVASQTWDDDLLFALLSHTLLIGFGSRRIEFFTQLAGGDERIATVLEDLSKIAHDRWGRGRFADYDPSGGTAPHRIAVYTANLVSLRLAMADGPVDLVHLCPTGADVRAWWPAQVRFWDALLHHAPDWAAFIAHLQVDGQAASWRARSGYTEDMVEMAALDQERAMRMAASRALLPPFDLNTVIDDAVPAAAFRLAVMLMTGFPAPDDLAWLSDAGPDLPAELAALLLAVASRNAADIAPSAAQGFVEAFHSLEGLNPTDVAAFVVQHADRLPQEGLDGSNEAKLMMTLRQIVTESPLSAQSRTSMESPEVRLLRGWPQDLALRLIPELARSLLSAGPTAPVENDH